jgi:hypothetical protein
MRELVVTEDAVCRSFEKAETQFLPQGGIVSLLKSVVLE